MVGLISSLAGLFAIGQLGQIWFDAATTPSGVHLLMAGIVIALIGTRLSERIPAAVLVACVAVGYVSSRALVEDPAAARSGAAALLMAVEVAFASASALLAVRVARGLNEFEESVANILLDEVAGVMSLDAARDDIAIEMSRARRHERPLTVMVLSFDPRVAHTSLHEIVRDLQRRMMQRYIMSGLARVAAQTTRRGDLVVQDPSANRVIVLTPESTPDQLAALKHRLEQSAYRSLGIPVRFGSAGFPTTALTFDDLVARASGDAASDAQPEQLERAAPVRPESRLDGPAVPAVRSFYRTAGDAPPSHLGEPAQVVNGD